MTRIDFYFNAANKIDTVCRLASKAARLRNKVLIFTLSEELARTLDKAMWLFQPTGFVPHCRAESPLAPETGVVIARALEDLTHDQILVNLDTKPPPAFSRFLRLIEIVSTTEEDRTAARLRFRFYKDRGYEINNHDLSRNEGA